MIKIIEDKMKRPARKKTIMTKVPLEESFKDRQLRLFQDFFSVDGTKDQFSNSIELWDATPKYHITRRRQSFMREGLFLPTVEHRFCHRGKFFKVRLDPARLKVNGQYKEFFPSYSEEIIEDVLRKMASDQQLGLGYLDDSRSGVRFSVHMLKKELRSRGHARSYSEIYDSLMILSGCHVTIASEDSEEICVGGILNSLAGVTRSHLDRDPGASWYADFCPLVTVAIRTHSCRQFNLYKSMSLSTQLARWIYKRLSHNFIQASCINSYKIKLSTLARDSLLLEDKRISQVIKRVDNALNELVEKHILRSSAKVTHRGPKNVIIDVDYELIPHADFIKEMKAANARAKKQKNLVHRSQRVAVGL